MIEENSPYKLNLDSETRKALEIAIVRRVEQAVADNATRNNDLQIWRDQLEGKGVTAQNKTWKDACDMTDPISMEAFLTLLSQITGASNRDPKVAVEAFAKEDEDSATTIEAWLSRAGAGVDIDRFIYDFAYNSCRDTATVGYVGWKQITRISRETGYRKPGSAIVYSEEEIDEDEDYDKVPVSEEVVSETFDIRTVDLSDFFLYPADASSVERATCVAERMYLTAEELIDGIEDFDFDRDSVEELISMGAIGEDEERQSRGQQDGTEEAQGNDGFYQVFTVYTRLPREAGTGYKVPSYLRQDDFLIVLSVDRSIVLKMVFSPFKERPYFMGGILPKPGKTIGHSLMCILEPMQDEANANIQCTIDGYNMTATPVLLIPKSEATEMNKYNIQPGAMIPCDEPKSVIPLEWNRAPLRDGLAWQQDLRNRSTALVSAPGAGALSSKVRKAAEVQDVAQAAASKFGMLLQNFQRTVITELYRRMLLLKLQFGSVDEEGEEFLDDEGETRTLTAQALRGRYRIVASGTSLSHSPETREAISRRKQEIQIGYLTAKQSIPDPAVHRLLWHSSRELLLDLGERNVEAWLGDEPPKQADPSQIASQGQQGAYAPQGQPGQQQQNPLAALGAAQGNGAH